MVAFLKKIRDSKSFQYFIIACIMLAGLLVGMETYPSVVARIGPTIDIIGALILWIFVAEIIIKMGAEGSKPWRYFLDPWNVFDFLIVVACVLPFDAEFITVLRLARILRVMKLLRAMPKLQILVGALLKSIPSIGYVSLLLFLLFYLYACSATFLFSQNDPIHFENLQISMVSLFRVVTLEDWTDIMYIQMYGCAGYGYGGHPELCTASDANPVLGALFFISFVLIGTMVIMNLFIGVIMTGMEEAQEEAEESLRAERRGRAATLEDELADLEKQFAAIETQVRRVRKLAGKIK
jgi:voltage-gated sodium channel